MKISSKKVSKMRVQRNENSILRIILASLFLMLSGYFFGSGKYVRALICFVCGVSIYANIPYFDVINAVFVGINLVLFCTMHVLNYLGVGKSTVTFLSRF